MPEADPVTMLPALAPGLLTRAMANESLRCSPELGHLYLNNAKAGCSTVKNALWMQALAHGLVAGPPEGAALHGRGFWRVALEPLDGLADRLFVFSFVRNPFVRLLSAYRDKVARPGHLRFRFCLQYGLDPKEPVSFARFLAHVCATDPYAMDQHWRPQRLNLLAGHLPLAFVGHLERLEEDWATVRDRTGAVLATARTGHATAAADHLGDYDEAGIDLVRRAYAADFALFGYGPDPADPAPLRGPVALPDTTPARTALLRSLYAPDPDTALAIVAAGLAEGPDEPLRLRRLALRLHDGEDAKAELLAWTKQHPDDETGLVLRRVVAGQEGRPGLVRQLTRTLATGFPHRAAYRLEWAAELLAQGLLGAALREARAARRLRPNHGAAPALLERIEAALAARDAAPPAA